MTCGAFARIACGKRGFGIMERHWLAKIWNVKILRVASFVKPAYLKIL
jgi:hypothetical protein